MRATSKVNKKKGINTKNIMEISTEPPIDLEKKKRRKRNSQDLGLDDKTLYYATHQEKKCESRIGREVLCLPRSLQDTGGNVYQRLEFRGEI